MEERNGYWLRYEEETTGTIYQSCLWVLQYISSLASEDSARTDICPRIKVDIDAGSESTTL